MASKFLLLHFISIMFLVSYTFATERDRPLNQQSIVQFQNQASSSFMLQYIIEFLMLSKQFGSIPIIVLFYKYIHQSTLHVLSLHYSG